MSEKKCPYCGASVDLNATECKYCGKTLVYKSQQAQPINTTYLKLYYKEEFEKIDSSNETYKGKWNWCAFFFTWIWALTKGLWGLALVTIGIDTLISSINSNLSWLSFVICIFYGVRGNYFYYNLVKNKKQFPSTF